MPTAPASGDTRWTARTLNTLILVTVVSVVAATSVGLWLSYGGLHAFAIRAGMSGPEAWAWPSAIDMITLAGEAGVAISVLRGQEDRGAWAYLVIGASMSVTGNIMHAHIGHIAWTPYAVAAVPPLAAMLALAALLRQVLQIVRSIDQGAVATVPEPVASAVATVMSVATEMPALSPGADTPPALTAAVANLVDTLATMTADMASDGQVLASPVATGGQARGQRPGDHAGQLATGQRAAMPAASEDASVATGGQVATDADTASPVATPAASRMANGGQPGGQVATVANVASPDVATDGQVANPPVATRSPVAKLATDPAARTRAAAKDNPGKSNDELAAFLGISARSVRRHLSGGDPVA